MTEPVHPIGSFSKRLARNRSGLIIKWDNVVEEGEHEVIVSQRPLGFTE